MKELIQVVITINPEIESATVEFLQKFSPVSVSVEFGHEFTHCIKAFFEILPDNFYAEMQQYFRSLPGFGLDPGDYNIKIDQLKAADWENAWKDFYQPLAIGKSILILPEWLEVPPKNKRTVIKMNPGMAFGTGQHPSTRLCLEMAESLLKPDMSVLDAGCGSGVLAIYAAKCGCKPVVGLDIDPDTLPVAVHNTLINDLTNQVLWLAGEVNTINDQSFDLIFLNLTSEIIMKVAGKAINHLNNDGFCLFSGIIETDKSKITSFIADLGLEIVEIRENSGWIGIVSLKYA